MEDQELIKTGNIFGRILDNLKRRHEDAALELGCGVEEINDIISGKKELPFELVKRACGIWPVNVGDFYPIRDDCPTGVKFMRAEDSERTTRIMQRAGKDYYKYRDTVTSSLSPFRPERIQELCVVDNNDVNNPLIQWNNGHFMHQFTYFIGSVNFYFMRNGRKEVAIMNTGDSMYITPFIPHTFATRKNNDNELGLILALTYGNKLAGDAEKELSAIGPELGSQFHLDFSTKGKALASLIKYHREIASITPESIEEMSGGRISKERLSNYESGDVESIDELKLSILADILNVNVRDLLPPDYIDPKVIIQPYNTARRRLFPDQTKPIYELVELASTKALPYSKGLELRVLSDDGYTNFDLRTGLHQYVYNIGDTPIHMNWENNKESNHNKIYPNDSAYTKPFVRHNFRGDGKLLILRIGGNIAGDAQRELSMLNKEGVERAIKETTPWFNPEGKS